MKAVPIFTEDELQYMLENLDQYSPEEQAEIDKIADVLSKRSLTERCRKDLIAFCLHMQPDYKVGKHHRILADTLMATAKGEKDRVCVNIAPRHGKSQLTSIYFPAWFIGNYPNTKLLMVGHTTDLAVDFGRKVRNLIDTDEYRSIFPDVHLASDSKSAGRWNTTTGNEYYACGVGSALAGRGADLLLIDDPHNEQDIINGNFEVFDKAYEWFTYGARTRLMPGGRVALVMTRWHQSDLTGRVTNDMAQNELADKYEVIEFPAIMEVPVSKDSTETVEKPLWPEFFDLKALHRTRASMPVFQWNAQYQQNPTSEEASIIKREWWNTWLKDDPPECEYIIMTLDAAAETHNRADFTAITTWGVFMNNSHDGPGLGTYNIILLNAIKKRIEFTDLKELALSEYKYWNPDSFIVEKKSSGTALYQEFRRMGIPVQEYTPHRGSGDKLARLNSVADIVKSGLCWVPQTRWAEEVVEEIAGFPFMAHDDLCVAEDTMVLMATGEEVPITKVRVGDYVQTPIGPRKVLSSHCTGVKNTHQIFVAGRELRITDNHPIATVNGWKTLREIKRSDAIIHVSQAIGELAWGLCVTERVYNLSVEGAECYYANGVLVHNCDTTVMALMRYRNGGFIRLPSDEPEDVRYFKSRSGNRYY